MSLIIPVERSLTDQSPGTMENRYYQHSGSFTIGGLLMAALGASIVASILGAAYAYLILYVPFIYLNALGTVGLGFAAGYVLSWLLRSSHVRSPKAALITGGLVGLVALHASWAFWSYAFIFRMDEEASLGLLYLNPLALAEFIGIVNENGAWTIFGSTPTGAMLWLVWLVEAAIIVGLAALTARAGIAATPYCESCSSWCVESKNVVEVTGADAALLKERVEARDFAYVETLAPRVSGDGFWFSLHLNECPKCGSTNTLSLDETTLEVDDKGKEETKSNTIVDNLLIEPVDAARLRAVRGLGAPVAA